MLTKGSSKFLDSQLYSYNTFKGKNKGVENKIDELVSLDAESPRADVESIDLTRESNDNLLGFKRGTSNNQKKIIVKGKLQGDDFTNTAC